MTETDQGDLYFDVRQSVRMRNILRLVIAPLLSVVLIWIGFLLIPEETVLQLRIESIETWSAWSFLGLVCIGSGIYRLFKELIFAIRAISTKGEWHFRLTDHSLLWHVPKHAHGTEEGFEVPLEELSQIEIRTIEKTEGIDEREYWIHFHSRDPVQLRSYSGVSLSWLAEKIRAAGVPYEETCVRY